MNTTREETLGCKRKKIVARRTFLSLFKGVVNTEKRLPRKLIYGNFIKEAIGDDKEEGE